ncbi:hypothetical protein [Pseudarthrobacter sp. S9]|uniref:hypothetical protein n=1 Tax=Pseudarthrobacter sp. S9 TaxID=3418421 RepID=UPI003D01E15D
MDTPAHIRARLAYGSRRDVQYPPEVLADLRRDYHAARLAENIRRVVKESGPFTAEQKMALACIITGAPMGVAA